MKLHQGAFWLGTLLFFAVSFQAEAASLYIDPAISTLNRGDAVTLAVRLDTDEVADECVNVIDATIQYSENIEPVDVSVGESILSIWLERPVINTLERTITFAGGIPNGYCGRVLGDPRLTNVLAEVIFRSPGMIIGGGDIDTSKAEVYFADTTRVLLNDGQGTPAELTTYGARFDLTKRPGAELKNDWQDEVSADVTPPEEFTIEFAQYPDGKYYVTFTTTDKQTGIDRFEVMEVPASSLGAFRWGDSAAPWIIPSHGTVHVLKDQTLNSVIYVKAVDKAGNEYIAKYAPPESMRQITRAEIVTYVVISFLILTLFMLSFIFWKVIVRRNQKRKKRLENTDEETEFEEESDDDDNYEHHE
tara:strand:+ start:12414 stop:13496 length:1083 start_codon:yes stop_codon:yes gene_type:complete